MRLQEENGKLSGDIAQQQAQLETINARIAEAEEMLSHDRTREEGQSLEHQVRTLAPMALTLARCMWSSSSGWFPFCIFYGE